MKINCAKCGKLVAVSEYRSIKIDSGAPLFGACYECKSKSLHEGGKGDFEKDFFSFVQGLWKP